MKKLLKEPSSPERSPFSPSKRGSKFLDQIDATRKAMGEMEYSKAATKIPEY